jgi:2-amino-4-hydroxy-6-hydroxymethyldihydropteridine diphosphokinase
MFHMAVVFLALGANLGDRERNLNESLVRLAPFVHVTSSSAIYETEPVGVREQPWFLNMVVRGTTTLSPVDLLRRVKKIEIEMGRSEGIRFGPRPIDIDILFYDRVIELSPALTIPHPRLHERAFVLVPLAEIASDFVHPRFRTRIRDLLARLESTDEVRPYKPRE